MGQSLGKREPDCSITTEAYEEVHGCNFQLQHPSLRQSEGLSHDVTELKVQYLEIMTEGTDTEHAQSRFPLFIPILAAHLRSTCLPADTQCYVL